MWEPVNNTESPVPPLTRFPGTPYAPSSLRIPALSPLGPFPFLVNGVEDTNLRVGPAVDQPTREPGATRRWGHLLNLQEFRKPVGKAARSSKSRYDGGVCRPPKSADPTPQGFPLQGPQTGESWGPGAHRTQHAEDPCRLPVGSRKPGHRLGGTKFGPRSWIPKLRGKGTERRASQNRPEPLLAGSPPGPGSLQSAAGAHYHGPLKGSEALFR